MRESVAFESLKNDSQIIPDNIAPLINKLAFGAKTLAGKNRSWQEPGERVARKLPEARGQWMPEDGKYQEDHIAIFLPPKKRVLFFSFLTAFVMVAFHQLFELAQVAARIVWTTWLSPVVVTPPFL